MKLLLNKLRKGEWKVVAPSEGKYVIKGSYQDSYFELVVDKLLIFLIPETLA